MNFGRAAGILLHPTSLPGPYGIGDLGVEAKNFINFLHSSGQKLWQMFPLGPTGYGDSPYQSFSTFAGNPMLISPDELLKEGLLSESDLRNKPEFDPLRIDFGRAINYKTGLLRLAFENYLQSGLKTKPEIDAFCRSNSYWINDYALFMAVKAHHGGIIWKDWSKDIAFRKPGAVQAWTEKLSKEVEFQKFMQFHFDKQWKSVRKYANSKGIKIIGDLPIFIAYDSSDLWANKEQFTVNDSGDLETVAGVPPDYFSPTGQLWGNPLYRWKVMEKDHFSWWIKRFSKCFELVDIVRIDHFRGLDAFWEIKGGSLTAEKGRWVKAPGEALFTELMKQMKDAPIIAEDLGVITKSVNDLRTRFSFPGMRILQFAFGRDGDKRFLPHNYDKNTVVFSGSHDNDTTKGFFEAEKSGSSDIYRWAQNYLNYYGTDICYEIIRTAYASVADTVIIPMQDMLSLGSEARMNFPGRPAGNWGWRFKWEQVPEELAARYKRMCEYFQRPADNKNPYAEIKVYAE